MNYFIIFMLVAVHVAPNYACPEFAEHRPDYKHIPGTRAFYKLHKTKATWYDAKTTCEREGTTLFYPENESEANTVMTFWQKTEPEEYSYWIFVGMKRSCNTFKTINGTDISEVFHNWLEGEPNNQGGDENCVELFREVVPHIKWLINDAPCSLKFTFICKSPEIPQSYDAVTDKPRPVEGPKEYKLIPGTNSLYSRHQTIKTWEEAWKTCKNEGATLFYPETEREADAVIDYFSKEDESFSTTFFFIGLKRSGRSFQLMNGTTITRQQTIIAWVDGEPDIESEGMDCVIMLEYWDWSLTTWSCNEKEEFICKKNNPVPPAPTIPVTVKIPTVPIPIVPTVQVPTVNVPTVQIPTVNVPTVQIPTVQIPSVKVPTVQVTTVTVPTVQVTTVNVPTVQVPTVKVLTVQVPTVQVPTVKVPSVQVPTVKVPTVPVPVITVLNQECGMNNTHYKYSEAVGKCYRIGTTPKTWAEARDVCISEGSDLAVINSHQEANYLVEQISKTLTLRIPGTFVRGVVHLGFHNNHVEDWQTIDGTSLYYSGYACWGSQQPDEDKCGSMLYNGHLNAIGCQQKAIFICEHTSPDYYIEPPSGDILRQSLTCE